MHMNVLDVLEMEFGNANSLRMNLELFRVNVPFKNFAT